MTGREIGPGRLMYAALVAASLLAAPAHAGDPRAAERFRAAAALQARSLYDLAAAEYAAIETEFAADPLAQRARLQRGICLFQLHQFADARVELATLRLQQQELNDGEREQCWAYLGLAEYNVSLNVDGDARNEHLDAAIDALDRQLERFPSGTLAPRAAFYRAEALYTRGRLDDAVAAYRSLIETYRTHPRRGDVLYALGVAEQERHNFTAAIDAFAQFEQEFPQHPSRDDAHARRGDALMALAESQLAERRTQDARQSVDRLLGEFPESALVPQALFVRAQLELGAADPKSAEATLDDCLRRSTHALVSTSAHLLRAKARYELGNYSGGLADASAVLAVDPHRAEAAHLRGLCEARLGRLAEAAHTLARLADVPQFADADRVLYELAWVHEQAGDPPQALADYERIVSEHPQSALVPECRFRAGEVLYAQRKFEQAASRYRAALAAAQDPALRERAAHRLAWCHFEQRQYATAQADFAAQLADHPQGPLAADARVLAAECSFQLGQYADALARFEAVLDDRTMRDSLRAMALVHASDAAGHVQRWPRSLELADRALAEFPDHDWADEARCNRGAALYELGRFDDARRELSAIAASHEGLLKAKAEFTLGKIHVARQEYDDAIRVFFKVAYGHGGAAAPQPLHAWQAEAMFAAASVLERTGRQDAARKLYQELIDAYPTSPRTASARESLEHNLQR